ncbi:MAG: response regulator [Deltaproteobacteria bacterium]|nr:response regulator [Deltaproteobacteria bacterium]
MSKQIFLIEDDIDHAELITTFLKVDGIENEIIWFRDAESSIGRLKEIEEKDESVPALIIIDLKLPRMDGFGLISHIRNIDKFSKIPIIVISSSSQPSDISRALEVGAEEFINKLAAQKP